MTRRLAFSNVTDLLRHDEALVAALTEYSTHGRRVSVPLTNFHWGYTVQVGVGGTMYDLIVDSASAITWVGARAAYESSTGIDTRVPVGYNYGYASFEVSIGTLFEDSMIFNADGLYIPRMQFGVASTSEGLAFDGVLGIGPRDLIRGTLDPPATVIDYMVQQSGIHEPVIGIFFQPFGERSLNYRHGEISFGGADPQRYTGSIEYTITYGDTGIEILPYTAGVVNCGGTFLYISSDAFERYQAVTGGTVNAANGLLQISRPQYGALRSLYFQIGENTYRFNRNAQIWPRSLNYRLDGGGRNDDIFLIIRGLQSPTGSGLDFINGYVFLQRFYTVFDSGIRPRVGFAETRFTYDTSN
ncbi:aspartic peptidase domain-containing protein [Suillus spraguei]|nr:aspartic peptidase domain-containing protein [Suillus spraguei]